jgi:3-dehydroquinate synthase
LNVERLNVRGLQYHEAMQRLTVASRYGDYEILARPGLVEDLCEVLADEGVSRPRTVVSNTTVAPLWASAVATSMAVPLIELADGEAEKRWPTVEDLLGRWLEEGLTRGDSAAAIGGGVLTDTVGFAAAVYLRGISWIAVPTTLLAMVDASVGGKTGVNLEQGKNLVGSFWPPRLVVVDVATLSTLPARELSAGMAEVVKTAWIGDHDLLDAIPDRLDGFDTLGPDQWQEIVMRCLAVKSRIVSDDEREAGERASLNLGHTLGHALEAATGYRRFLHGEAVAWGLLAAARLARRRGLLTAAGEDRLREATRSIDALPAIANIDPESLRAHIGRDKKRDAEGVAWVLPTDDGVVLNQRVETDEALEVFSVLQRESPQEQ